MNESMRQPAPRFLDTLDVARAWSAVRDLSGEFEKWEQWSSLPPAISGWWGGAILHLAYHQRLERSDEREKAMGDLLDTGLEAAARVRFSNFYGGLSGLGVPWISTMILEGNCSATHSAISAIESDSSDPTLYGRQDSPRKRIVHNQITRSAAYR